MRMLARPPSTSGLRVCVLGGLGVTVDDQPVAVRGTVRRRLLLALLAAPGPLSADALVDAVWPAGGGSAQTLHVHIFRLRRDLDPSGDRGGRWLLSSADGYRLCSDFVDIDEVERDLIEAGRIAGVDPVGATGRLRSALDRVRDPATEDLPAWEARLRRLHQCRRTAEETWAGLLVDAGRAGPEADRILELARAEPERETRWVLAMRALAQARRTREALAAYREGRNILVEEFGIEPGREMYQCHQAILRLGADPVVGAATGAPPPAALPRPVTTFVGRSEQLELLTRAIGRNRIVTLHGMGGIGKSRLITEWLHRSGHASATHWVDLRGVRPGDVAHRSATTMGMTPSDTTTARCLDAMIFGVGPAPVTIVLDNADELTEETGLLCLSLTSALPQLTIVVTSRVPLGVSGERPLLIPPLAPDDARHLAAERLGASEQQRIRRIAARSGGLPLAIELLSGAGDQAHSEDERVIGELTDVVKESMAGLSPEAVLLLRAMRQLPGGAPTSLIDILVGGQASRQRLLRELVASSLVVTEARGGAHPVLRYKVLQPLTELEAVWRSGAEVAQADASAALEGWLSARLRTSYAPTPRVSGILDVAGEWTNLDPALAHWAQTEPAVILRLAVGLMDYFAYFGRAEEGRTWLSRALNTAAERASSRDRADALLGLTRGGGIARFATNQPILDQAITLLGASDPRDQALTAMAHVFRSAGFGWVGRRAEALADLRAATEAATRASSPWIDANVRQLGYAIASTDLASPDATDEFVAVAETFESLGDAHDAALTFHFTLGLCRLRGNGRVEEIQRRLLDCAAGNTSPMLQALVAQEVARTAADRGQLTLTTELAEAIAVMERSGTHRAAALIRRDIGLALLDRGSVEAAERELREAASRLGHLDPGSAALAAAGLANLHVGTPLATHLAGLAWACAESHHGVPVSPAARDRLAALIGPPPTQLPDPASAGEELRVLLLNAS